MIRTTETLYVSFDVTHTQQMSRAIERCSANTTIYEKQTRMKYKNQLPKFQNPLVICIIRLVLHHCPLSFVHHFVRYPMRARITLLHSQYSQCLFSRAIIAYNTYKTTYFIKQTIMKNTTIRYTCKNKLS